MLSVLFLRSVDVLGKAWAPVLLRISGTVFP